jgi:hypothetical protein
MRTTPPRECRDPARAARARPRDATQLPDLLSAQRTAGNRAVAALVAQRTPVTVQRDWTGDRTDEVRAAMTGDDWNRAGGPWFLLNGHNPAGLAGIMRRLGSSDRRRLAAHPVDGTRYDKERLDFALGKGTEAELSAMDAIRNARAGVITWPDCWAALGQLRAADRATLYRAMDRTELRDLLTHAATADQRRQAAFEEEINAVIAPPVKDVLLDFVPDDSELPGPAGTPWPMGKITVLLKGVPVASVPARGGPWKSHKDPNNPGHTADPTKPGTFTLAAGKPIVTSAWMFSQLADGTPIRDTGTDVEFERNGTWVSTSKLAKPIPRHSIMKQSARVLLIRDFRSGVRNLTDTKAKWDAMVAADDFGPLTSTWVLNDFGTEGFVIEGSEGDIIHTTPETDDPNEVLQPGNLEFSHGCVHLRAADRDALIEMGFLRGGVKLKVHPYDPAKLSKWGDPP